MTETGKNGVPAFDRAAWPALTAFFRGYLHQDAADEHRSMAAAFDAFWMEAGDAERRRFTDEWRALTALIETHSWTRLRRALEALGAAWIPGGRAGFSALQRAVRRKSSGAVH